MNSTDTKGQNQRPQLPNRRLRNRDQEPERHRSVGVNQRPLSYVPVRQQSSDQARTLPCRTAQVIVHFETLDDTEQLNKLAKQLQSIAQVANYDGKNHGMFAVALRRMTARRGTPLRVDEQNKLSTILQSYQPKLPWSWLSLATTWHSMVSAGVFRQTTRFDLETKKTCTVLFEELLNVITLKSAQTDTLQDMDSQALANLVWAMAKETEFSEQAIVELTPAVEALLPHVISFNGRFSNQGVVSLMWALSKLLGSGLLLTDLFRATLAALLPNVERRKSEFSPRELAILMWSMAKLLDSAMVPSPLFMSALTALFPCLIAREYHFNSLDVTNLLWSMAKLAEHIRQLTGHKRVVLRLLPRVRALKEQFDPQGIASTAWAIAKLLDSGFSLNFEIKESVPILLLQVQVHRMRFDARSVANLMWAMAKLLDCGFALTAKLKETVTIMLSRVRIRVMQFKPHGIANLVWSLAVLVEHEFPRSSQLSETVKALMPQVIALADQFEVRGLSNQMWALAKLVGNGIDLDESIVSGVRALSVRVCACPEFFSPQGAANTLWAVAKLVADGLELTYELKELVVVLLPYVPFYLKDFNPRSIVSLVWAMAELVEVEPPLPGLREAADDLLSCVLVVTDQGKRPEVINLIWALAKLVDNGFELTPQMQETVIDLLSRVRDADYGPPWLANLLWAIACLVANGLALASAELTLLARLLLQVRANKDQFDAQAIANLFRSLAQLMDSGYEPVNEIVQTAVVLTPHVERHKESFTARDVTCLMWAKAKLMDQSPPLVPVLKRLVMVLLPLMEKCKEHFTIRSVAPLVWALAKLVENKVELTLPLKKAVSVLLPCVSVMSDQLSAQSVADVLWSLARLVDYGLKCTPDLSEVVSILVQQVEGHKGQLPSQGVASLLWAIPLMGELVEAPEVAISALMFGPDQYHQFDDSELMMSLWGMLCVSSRRFLHHQVVKDEYHRPLQQLFNHLQQQPCENNKDMAIMAVAASWLGVKCPLRPVYRQPQAYPELYQQLKLLFPMVMIEQGKSINLLPPVDLYMPEIGVILEVQRPSQFVDWNLEVRSGPTLMKIAQYLRLGLKVIEIPLNQAGRLEPHVISCIDRAVDARLASKVKTHTPPNSLH